ncbi:hypothetical protein [Luteococcus sp.]|uniref:hypothetical protein n=1 Tax=Luteococcus sp. TaxID=1969402 RepID=UPI003735624F
MGTQDPLVHIEAATLAGGDNNQDRYAYGDGWAFVLDGASSFSDVPPVHDGGWYAERLRNALTVGLATGQQTTTPQIVGRAIRMASADHDEHKQGPCPNSTIALARWDSQWLDLYALGDSSIFCATKSGILEVTDHRINSVGIDVRRKYAQRLRTGSGFDEHHRELLAELQQKQLSLRNKNDGYWIAGSQPEAARVAEARRLCRSDVKSLILNTDGVPSETARNLLENGAAMEGLQEVLRRLHGHEERDPNGVQVPRGKVHDDKTMVSVEFMTV